MAATIRCRKCQGMTNSVVADGVNYNDKTAERCYVKTSATGWDKGCAYYEADTLMKQVCDQMIKGGR